MAATSAVPPYLNEPQRDSVALIRALIREGMMQEMLLRTAEQILWILGR